MFQLYKKRNFSELVGDTFTFFKMHGKHYYRNYFIVNGGFLLVLLVLVYFLMKVFFEGLSSNFGGGVDTMNNNFESYINNNLTFVFSLGILSVICILFLSLLSYAFPVVYLNLLEKKSDFETNEIIAAIKNKLGKIIVFFIASLFIMIPLMMILLVISFALIFILIGIPIILVLMPTLTCWFSLSFYNYISTDKGYFESLSDGLSLLKQKFWPTVGSTAVMYLIMQMVVGFVSMIPYLIGIFSMITTLDTQTPPAGGFGSEQFSFLMLMMGITMILSIVMNFIFQNFILINQGIIYYSLREENENNTPKSEIDLIGTYSE